MEEQAQAQDNLFPLPSPKPREVPRDEIWDALEEEFGVVRTKSERGRRNRAVRELREAEVTPDEVKIAVDFCRRSFTHFTEVAVCSWLSRALHEDSSNDNTREGFLRLLGKDS